MRIKTKIILSIAVSFLIYFVLISSLAIYMLNNNSKKFYIKWLNEDETSLEILFDYMFHNLEDKYLLYQSGTKKDLMQGFKEFTYIFQFDEVCNVRDVVVNPSYKENLSEEFVKSICEASFVTNLPKKGFLKYDSLYIIFSAPIFEDGRNFLVITKKIDSQELENLKTLLEVDKLEFVEKKEEVEGEVSVFYPIYSPKNHPIGYMRLAYINQIDELVMDSYIKGVLISGGILAFLLLLVSEIIDYRIFSRFEKLSGYIEEIKVRGYRKGEINLIDKIGENDEITKLAEALEDAFNLIEKEKQEIKRLNEDLQTLNKILRHDIMNDLAVIRGYAEIASESSPDCKYCEKILSRVDKAVDVIKKVKLYEESIQRQDLRLIRLSEVISSVMYNYDIKWVLLGDAEVFADYGIYSVFDNLVSNAVKHGETKTIRFLVRCHGDYAIIEVADFGKGIPDELKEKIFEEGFTTGNGMGLGLFLVKKLIEKYGGEIYVKDNKPRGTVFTIKLKAENCEIWGNGS